MRVLLVDDEPPALERMTVFFGNIPDKKTRQIKLYADSYHLLMYDKKKDQVITDVERWLSGLPKKRK